VAAIEMVGATPVLIDIEPDFYTMDPAELAEVLAHPPASVPPIRAVIPVHLYGQPVALDPIVEACRRHGVAVIEDCAQAHGATIGAHKVGTFSEVATFSFYPTKNLGALGDGGMLATQDTTLGADIAALRQYGWRTHYISDAVGVNSRLDEMQAAILRVKLRHMSEWTAARQAHARLYDSLLADVPGLLPPRVPTGREHVYYLYTVRVEGRVGGYTRANDKGNEVRSDLVQRRLKERGIASMVYYPVPLHLQPLYASLGGKIGDLRVSERAAREVLSIPIYPELRREQIERVATEVRNAVLDTK
jgi:dTDP-4-amino-4,6-dideoxygalactose transaminase